MSDETWVAVTAQCSCGWQGPMIRFEAPGWPGTDGLSALDKQARAEAVGHKCGEKASIRVAMWQVGPPS